MATEWPIFPLRAVPLPGIRLPLRIFERRYLDMLTRQMRAGRGFVIAQINQGQEAGVASFLPVAVQVDIVDWDPLPDGLLGITVQGVQPLRILAHSTQEDGLVIGQCETCLTARESLPSEPMSAWDGLLDVLDQLKAHPTVANLQLPEVEDTEALTWQLLQLLPLTAKQRQAALPLSTRERLIWLATTLDGLSKG